MPAHPPRDRAAATPAALPWRALALAAPALAGALVLAAQRAGADPPPPPEASLSLAADTWVSPAPPHTHHGAEPALRVGGPQAARALVAVSTPDLRAAVAGRALVSARLELPHVAPPPAHGRPAAPVVDARRLTRAWTEAGATWQSPDDPGPRPRTRWDLDARRAEDRPFVASPSASAAPAAGVLALDVTADVLAFLTGAAANHGWILQARDDDRRDDDRRGRGAPGAALELGAREAASPPRLVLVLGASSATSLAAASGDLPSGRPGEALAQPLVVAVRDANGAGVAGYPVTFAVTGGAATLEGPQPAVTDAQGLARAPVRLGPTPGLVTVTATAPGLAGSPVTLRAVVLPPPAALVAAADTYVSRLRPNRAHGGEAALRVRAFGRERALVRFDPAAVAAALDGATLERAVLEATLEGPVDLPGECRPGGFSVAAHRLLVPWTEAGATWNSPDDADPTNHRRDGPRWSLTCPPLPFVAAPTAAVALVRGQAGVVTWDVTADLAALLAGEAPHHGWLLKSAREHAPGKAAFRSRETSSPPRLLLYLRDARPPTVTIERPAPDACVGPTSAARATFADAGGLLPGSVVVRSNGLDVTAAFTLGPASVEAPLAAIASTLVAGPGNALEVAVRDLAGNPGSATTTFTYDPVAPTLALEPADGAVVGSASVLLRATFADVGCGAAPATFAATLDGAPLPFAVGAGEATATSPPLAEGPHTLAASLADAAGNVTAATTTFVVRLTGDLFGVVAGGTSPEDARVLAGVRVRAVGRGVEAVTDEFGQFTLAGLDPGPVQVVADGQAVGHGRAALTVTVAGGRLTSADRAWVVAPLDPAASAPFTLDAAGRTTGPVVVTSPALPGVRVAVAAGTRVRLPEGFAFPAGEGPRLTLSRVAFSVLGNPLPASGDPAAPWFAPWAYVVEPAGAVLVEGYELELPNDQGFAPGAAVPFFLYSEADAAWLREGDLVVSADGLRLAGHVQSPIGPGLAVAPGASYLLPVQVQVFRPTGNVTIQSGGAGLVQVTNPPAPSAPTVVVPVVGPAPGAGGSVPTLPSLLGTTTTGTGNPAPAPSLASTTQALAPPPGVWTPPGPNPLLVLAPITYVGPVVNRPATPLPTGNVLTVNGGHPLRAAQPGRQRVLDGPNVPSSYLGPADLSPAGFPYDVLVDGPFDLLVPGTSTRVPSAGLVDRTPPTVGLTVVGAGVLDTGPNAGALVAPRLVVDVSHADAIGGLWKLRARLLSPAALETPWVFLGAGGQPGPRDPPPTRLDLDAHAVNGAVHELLARVSDTAAAQQLPDAQAGLGNQAFTATVRVVRDGVPPTLGAPSFEAPALRRTPATITVAVSDDLDLDRVELLRDGAPLPQPVPPGRAADVVTFVEFAYGTHAYALRVVDEAGNATTAPTVALYTFDDRGPVAAATLVASPLRTPAATPQVRVEARDEHAGLAAFRVERRPAGGGPFVDVGGGAFGGAPDAQEAAVFTDAPLPSGRYEYQVRVTDRLGNETLAAVPGALVVDLDAPALAIAPTGVVVGSFPLPFTVVAEDRTGVDPATLVFTIDGARQPPTSVSSVQVGPDLVRTTATYLVQRLVEGVHALEARAADGGGLVGVATGTLVQDHSRPVLEALTPADGALVAASPVVFVAAYRDEPAGSGPVAVQALLASPPGAPPVDVTAQAVVGPAGLTLPLALAEGPHRLTLSLFDAGGNVTTATRTVTVDRTAPTITAVVAPPAAPAWTADRAGRVVADLADAGVGLDPATLEVLLDGVDVTTRAQVTPGRVELVTPLGLPDGPHEVVVRLRDRAGNAAAPLAAAFRVDATGPTRPGVPVAGARPLEPTTTVRWAPATDAGAGLAVYVVERTENDGVDWVEVARTASTEAALPTPTAEGSALRVLAEDALGNRGPAAVARGCELTGLDDLSAPVQTTLAVEVVRGDGTPVVAAAIVERGSGAPLLPVGGGRYASAPLTVPAGTPLRLEVLVDGEAFVSGPLLPLLPEVTRTDFGRLVVVSRRLASSVVGAAGSTPAPVASGVSLAFTLGEPFAAGPPPQAGGGLRLDAGFWHTVEDGGPAARVRLLAPPPVVCDHRWEALYFEVFADAGTPVDLVAERSLDGGATWQPLTVVGALAGLPATPAGRRHVVLWDVGQDLAGVAHADVLVRLHPAGRPDLASRAQVAAFRAFAVAAVDPPAGTLDVDPAGAFTLTFTRPVTGDLANVASSTALVDARTGAALPVSVAVAGERVVVTPGAPLAPGAELALRVVPGLLAAGDPAAFDQDPRRTGLTPFEAGYRVGAVDTAGPRLVASAPADGAAGVPAGLTLLRLVFDEPLDPASVGPASVVLVSNVEGGVPASVVLLGDSTSLALAPVGPLQPDRCYSILVGPGLRDLAGNRVVPVATSFATVTTQPPVPAAPTLVVPAAGSTITSFTAPVPSLAGTGPPLTTVALYVDGYDSGLELPVDAAGVFSGVLGRLPEGALRLSARALNAAGGASAASAEVPIVVATGALRSPPGQLTLHEVVAGTSGLPYQEQTLELGGLAPGGVGVLRVATAAAGFLVPAFLEVAAGNGGAGRRDVTPGEVDLLVVADATGRVRVTCGGYEAAGDGSTFTLLDAATLLPVGPARSVAAVLPQAFGTLPRTGGEAPLHPVVKGVVRLEDGGVARIEDLAGLDVRVQAVDELGQPADFVTINGARGGFGAVVRLDGSGAAEVVLDLLEPRPFRLVFLGTDMRARTGDRPRLGESELHDPAGLFPPQLSISSQLTSLATPLLSASYGANAKCATTGCPPEYPALGANFEITVGTPSSPTGRAGRSVCLSNGAEHLSRVDLVIAGRGGASFALTRTYRSNVLYTGTLGERWSHGYDQRLVLRPSGDVDWAQGCARTDTFTRQPDASYRSPTGHFARLSFAGPPATAPATLREADGTRLEFLPQDHVVAPGALAALRDRHGNALTLEYAPAGALGRLVRVVDPFGRAVDFSYDARGRLATVRDFSGRTVRYEYGAHNDLVRVTSPAVVATTEGGALLPEQQAPGGRAEVYGYTTGHADERLNHLLRFQVAPVEAARLATATPAQLEDPAALAPLARVELTWGTDPDPHSFARVVKERIGGEGPLPAWTGQAAPQRAGGTVSFHYAPVPATSGALNAPAARTTVVDRNGNVSEYFHNRAGQCVRFRAHANRNLRPRGAGPGEDPAFFERTWVFDKDGLPLVVTHPMGGVERLVHGDEDLDGDGRLTAGLDWNGDGDFDDPEDTQPEDDPRYAYDAGDGALDALPRAAAASVLREEVAPDARGDSRGGQRSRVWTTTYEPVFNLPRTRTDPRGHDPTYTPQNGGAPSAARYTGTAFFDYQQALDVAGTRAALAAELGVPPGELDARLAAAGVALGLGDLNGAPSDDGRRAGDVVRAVAPAVQLVPEQTYLRGVLGSTSQEVVTLSEFDAFGRPVRGVDPEHNVHRFDYHPSDDPDGDGVAVGGGAPSGPPGGHLAASHVDTSADPRRDSGTNPAPVRATTRLFYDPLGHPVRTIDPRGVEHRLEVTPLGEVVRTRAATAIVGPLVAEPTGALAAPDLETLLIHDANGRVVEVRVENAGERDGSATTVASNPYWTRKVAYDLLDDPVVTLAEVEPVRDDASLAVGSPGVVVGRVAYDGNQHPVLVTRPEGNLVSFVWDERDLLFQVTEGVGTAEAGTTTFHYTVNGTPLYVVDAVKHNPTRWPTLPGDVVRVRYDGFDEVLCATDPEGNCGDAVYDPCGRRVRSVRFATAEPGLPRLAEVEHFYDELGRPFRSDARVFTSGGSYDPLAWDRSIPAVGDPVPPGEAEARTLVELDRLGRPVRSVDPEGAERLAEFDGASRLTRALGPAFAALAGGPAVRNEVLATYNQAGQAVVVTSLDRSPVGPTQQQVQAFAAFDALGRLVEATDAAGQTARFVYDSRGLRIAASDARSTQQGVPGRTFYPGSVNGHGNVVHAWFDGLGRPVRSELLVKQGGQGDGQLGLDGVVSGLDLTNPTNPDGKLTLRQAWDRNSRLVARTDDNGNTTRWAYDARDRAVYTAGADLTVARTVYDADSLPVQSIDRNGTVVQRTFDGAGRLVKAEVVRRATNLEGTGQGVEGSAVLAWEYDGLSRVRLAVDQNDPADPADDVATGYAWDSLGRQVSERHRIRATTSVNAVFTQAGRLSVAAAGVDRTISRTFDLDSNRTSTTYSSGRTIGYGLDGADRVQRIVEGAVGVGPTLLATEWLGERPLRADAGNGVRTSYAYDLKRRLTALSHVAGGGAGATVAAFAYTWTRGDQRASETFSATGLATATQTFTYDSASRLVRVAFAGGAAPRPDTTWLLDGVGNQVKKVEDGVTTALNVRPTGAYAPDAMNEVVALTRFDAVGAVLGEERHVQDAAGSRLKDGQHRLFFDGFERLVRVERVSDGRTVGRYRYDAVGRRVDRQFVLPGETVVQQAYHVHDGAQEVEELDGAGAVRADFVWGGLYVDQLVQVRRGGGTYWAQTNSLFSVVALTDASGAVVERYSYSGAYGAGRVEDAAGAPRVSAAEVGNPWRFQGRRLDPETGWLYFRARWLDPAAGRWVSRDPLGIWGDPGQVGNAYSAFGNDPINGVDPSGLGPGGYLERLTTAWDAASAGNYGAALWHVFASNAELAPNGANPIPVVESYAAAVLTPENNLKDAAAAVPDAVLVGAGQLAGLVPVVGPVLGGVGQIRHGIGLIEQGGVAGVAGALHVAEGLGNIATGAVQGAGVTRAFVRGLAPPAPITATVEVPVHQIPTKASAARAEITGLRGQLARTLHAIELGTDPARGSGTPATSHRPHESAQGLAIEAATGTRLSRAPKAEGVDWLGGGQTFDAIGPIPRQHFNLAAISLQIQRHVKKADVVPLDIRNLDDPQIQQLKRVVGDLDPCDQSKIRWIR